MKGVSALTIPSVYFSVYWLVGFRMKWACWVTAYNEGERLKWRKYKKPADEAGFNVLKHFTLSQYILRFAC